MKAPLSAHRAPESHIDVLTEVGKARSDGLDDLWPTPAIFGSPLPSLALEVLTTFSVS